MSTTSPTFQIKKKNNNNNNEFIIIIIIIITCMIEEITGIQECPGFLYRDLELIS
jgi:hypothetical protein